MLKKLLGCALLMMAIPSLANDLKIDNAWARASIPGTVNGAAYATLSNDSDSAVKLLGMHSSASKKAELHKHQHADGMMKMVHVQHVVIQPGESLTMQPGGYHIMLMGLNQPLKAGETVEVTLQFDDKTQQISIPVRKSQE